MCRSTVSGLVDEISVSSGNVTYHVRDAGRIGGFSNITVLSVYRFQLVMRAENEILETNILKTRMFSQF